MLMMPVWYCLNLLHIWFDMVRWHAYLAYLVCKILQETSQIHPTISFQNRVFGTAGQRWPKWPTVGSQLPAGHPTWNDHSTTSKRSVWTASVVEMDIGLQLSNLTCYLTWSDLVDDQPLRRRRVPAPVTRRWRSTATFGSALWGISLPHRPVGSVSLAPVTIPGAPTSAALMRRVLGCSRQRSVDVGVMLNNVFKDGKCSSLEMDYYVFFLLTWVNLANCEIWLESRILCKVIIDLPNGQFNIWENWSKSK